MAMTTPLDPAASTEPSSSSASSLPVDEIHRMAMEKYNVVKAYAWSGQLGKRWSQELDKEHMLFEEAASRGHPALKFAVQQP